MLDLKLIPLDEYIRIQKTNMDKYKKLELLADMCRLNTLVSVKKAGSGHLGTSFSSMDIVIWLYYAEMNTIDIGIDSPDRDIYLSSKGHDVPGLYSVLFSLGIIPEEKILKLRRFGGLEGHADVSIRGIESNSGSLGMGISKGRGMAWAKQKLNHQGRIIVTIGDGELQEGQIYEALQTTIQQKLHNLFVIVDHNKVQSDKPVSEVIDLGNLMTKFQSFGWYTTRVNGHDFRELEKAFKNLKAIKEKPKILVADTIKGKGVSFMEHPEALKTGKGLYPWHAGAPDDQSYIKGFDEIINRVNSQLKEMGFNPVALKDIPSQNDTSTKNRMVLNALGEPISQAAVIRRREDSGEEYIVESYGRALLEIGKEHPELVVLDADLSSDCRLRAFESTIPKNFIENGIAEQDMVSMAGGLAHLGLLPVVNSFANFLASRANEQIYNNASENTKIIYACHYAGLIPAGPGKSHQSIRDISLFGALPNVTIIQPCNSVETHMAVKYCIEESLESCMLRMNIGPSPRDIQLPRNYLLKYGCGIKLVKGGDAMLFGYGPVMLHEALLASEILSDQQIGLTVINLPWLNRVNDKWLTQVITPFKKLFVIEDHSPIGGLGDYLLNRLSVLNLLRTRSLVKFAVEGYPCCGTPVEALRYHKLDGGSLAEQIKNFL